MSSATSIDRANVNNRVGGASSRPASQPAPDTFRPWHFFVLISLVAATAAVLMTRQARPEQLILITLTVGGAGFAAAALYRTLGPLVTKDPGAFQGSLTESMRAVLEREKGLVLRSIKELEFDRAMGKVSAKDFDEMAGRLRTRAMTLMRQLDVDGSGYHELIERELNARLPKAIARKGAHVRTEDRRSANPPASEPTEPQARIAAAHGCVCGTANDADAAFCKRCGTKLQEPTPS